MANKCRTLAFLGLLSAVLLVIGRGIGGEAGMWTALVLAVSLNIASWLYSDQAVLRLHGAREVPEQAAPELHRIVAECAARAGIPKPKVALIEGGAPNAFATGRSPQRGVVAVTSSLVQLLDARELRGVIAHELGHIKHRDTLIGAVSATIAAAVTHLAYLGQWAALFGRDDDDAGGMLGSMAMLFLAPVAALLIQTAISRTREFEADAAAVHIAGEAEGLTSALLKLDRAQQTMKMGAINPATAHLFIVSPLRGGGILSLFSTHPPIAERIRRMRQVSPRLARESNLA